MEIGIIGLGAMGSALLDGIINNKSTKASEISVYDVSNEKVNQVVENYSVKASDLKGLVIASDIIIIAVKPQDIRSLLTEIKQDIKNQLLLSICAGITIENIEKSFTEKVKVVRVMPNTPLMIGEGASGIAFNGGVLENEKEFIIDIFKSMGTAVEVPEKMMDAVTGLSGSGPAYVYMIIDALADGGVKAGLPKDLALKLAAQTLLGSAMLYLKSDKHPAQLKDMVCSPAGTTIEGLSTLEDRAVRGALIDAVFNAANRSKELAQS